MLFLSSAAVLTLQDDLALEFRAEACRLVNVERSKVGAPPLKAAPLLMKAAQAHAWDMESKAYFSHTTPEGRKFTFWAEWAGYKHQALAQNIAMGASTPAQLVALWLESPPHRKAMLRTDFEEMGMGHASEQLVSVLFVGQSKGALRLVINDEGPFAPRKASVYLGGLKVKPLRMRFREGESGWTEWRPYQGSTSWQFKTEPGAVKLTGQVEAAGGKVHEAEDWVVIQED